MSEPYENFEGGDDNEEPVVSDDEDDDGLGGLATIKKTTKKIQKDDEEESGDEEDDDEEEEEDDDDDEEEEEEQQEEESLNINDGDDNSFALNMNFDDFDNEDSDDDDDEDNYLQKFDEVNKNNLLESFHPELVSHNNDEIDALSIVTRDKNNNIIDDLHKTVPFITKYEIARIIGERAKQIDSGAEVFIDIDDNTIDSYLIALKEFNEKNIPFIIKRPLPNGACEYWKMTDLEILI